MREQESEAESVSLQGGDAKREMVVHNLIASVLPDRDLGEFKLHRAKIVKKPIDELTQEDLGEVEYMYNQYNSRRKNTEARLSKTNFSNEDLLLVFSGASKLAAELVQYSTEGNNKFRLEVVDVLDACQSKDGLEAWVSMWEEWKKVLQNDISKKEIASSFLWLFNGFNHVGWSSRPRPMTGDQVTALSKEILLLKQSEIRLGEVKKDNSQGVAEKAIESVWETYRVENVENYRKLYEYVATEKVDNDAAYQFLDVAYRYSRNHDFNSIQREGFEKNVLPRMLKGDPEVVVLQKQKNSWGMKRGEFGIADFVCHCYSTKASPEATHSLLMVLKEIPTSNFARFEQNRKDALALASVFGALRDFIHDQRPFVKEVVAAMVAYYDTRNSKELRKILAKTDYLSSNDRVDRVLDLDNYNELVEFSSQDGNIHEEKAIDVLRRLKVNTSAEEASHPATSDTVLNKRLEDVENGERSREVLQELLLHVNGILVNAYKENQIGLDPSQIEAIAWTERQLFKYFQTMDFEMQSGLYRMDFFREILRFQELTNSIHSYNEVQFEVFWSNVKSAGSSKEAYSLIQRKVLTQVSDMAKRYGESGKVYDSGVLWSGNLTHELIGLVDVKVPSTIIGAKYRGDQIKGRTGD